MKSNKQRREELRIRREKKLAKVPDPERERLLDDIAVGRTQPVDSTKIVSRSNWHATPIRYRDTPFTCRDCGVIEVWTAKQQKWWYEEAGGEIETVAIRCRKCREAERLRRENVRKAHQDGIRKKTKSA